MKTDGGSRPGNTHLERLAKARSGAFAGKKYPDDGFKMGTGAPSPRMAGSGSGIVSKSPIATPRTGNSPYERPMPVKPGYGTT